MADRYWRGGTGTWNGTNTVNWAAASTAATFTASRSGSVLTVSAMTSGTITNGDTVWHTNGTSIGTITSFGTGAGGTGTYNMSASGNVTSRTMSSATGGAAVPTASDNVIFDADSNVGTATFTVTVQTATGLCDDFTASGLDATMTLAGGNGITISGSLSLPASNFTRTNTGTITFNSTSTGKTVTSNGVTFANTIVFNGSGGGWTISDAFTTTGTFTLTLGTLTISAATSTGSFTQTAGALTISAETTVTGTTVLTAGTMTLGAALTSSGSFTLTAGTLTLASYTLTAATFSSSNSNVRTLDFGTGKIVLTGSNQIIWGSSTVTNMTVSGTPLVECTYSGGTGTRTITPGILSEANSISFSVTAGTDIIATNQVYRDLSFTGFAGSHTLNTITIYGSLTLSTGMTVTGAAATHTYAATSGTKTITTNGKTYDCAVTFNGVGSTFQLADALTMGSTRTLTLTNGALDVNDLTLTVGTFAASNSNVRTIDFGTGSIVAVASGTAFTAATATNLTVTHGTGAKVSMTSASAKTFAGGGASWPKLEQAGAGALTITGSNTFADISNTTQPVTVSFTAGTTSTFDAFSLAGTAGNLVTIGSVTAASHTLSKASGSVSVAYCTISRSTAQGGATWRAPTSAGNVDGANNSGWNFASVSTYEESVTEALAFTDTSAAQAVFGSAIAESLATSDSDAAQAVFGSAISESLALAETASGGLTILAGLTESLGVADAVAASLTLPAAISEALAFMDAAASLAALNPAISETLALTDANAAQIAFSAAVSELVSLTDAASLTGVYQAVLAENITVADYMVGGKDISVAIAESLGVSDAVASAILVIVILTGMLRIRPTLGADIETKARVAATATRIRAALAGKTNIGD